MSRALVPDCANIKESCECQLPFGHAGAHVCGCEGSWDDDGNILAWPNLVTDEGGPLPKGTRLDDSPLGIFLGFLVWTGNSEEGAS